MMSNSPHPWSGKTEVSASTAPRPAPGPAPEPAPRPAPGPTIERPLLFRSGEAQLCGMLHLPASAVETQPDIGLVFAQSGARGRLGNTFHYPYFARRLSAVGYPCLRFDPAGLGDSTGEIPAGNMRDLYGQIGAGRFVGDTLSAIDELYRQISPKRVVLFGVCGGAITALMAAPRSERVDGVILLSLPVMLDSAQQGQLGRMPHDYARNYLFRLYANKLLSLKAWKRLITRKSDTANIWSWVKASFLPQVHQARPGGTAGERDPAFNHHVLESLDALVARQRKLLLLFGQDDKIRYEWQRDFHDKYWNTNPRYEACSTIHNIANCNHMFTLREWQATAMDLAITWLQSL